MRNNFAKEWEEATGKLKKSGRNLNTPISYDNGGRNRSGYSDPTARDAIRNSSRKKK